MKVTQRALDLDPTGKDGLIIGAANRADRRTGLGQFAAVEGADSARADNKDLHEVPRCVLRKLG